MKSLCFVITLSTLLAHSLLAAETKYARPELLLEPAELAKPEVAAKFVILDVRSPADYEKTHIPGARRVDHDTWKKAFGDGSDEAAWSKRISELGISSETNVVLYDNAASKDAARIWWILHYWGQNHARLLNGGWVGWTTAKFPTSTEAPGAAAHADFHAKPHHQMFADKAEVLALIGNGSQILDARSNGEFRGKMSLGNKRTGCMPGAKHLDWSDLIDKQTQRFKSAAEIQKLFASAKIDLAKPTTTHCQSGGRSSVMAFALELMGAKEVRNYYNGWSEWGNADETPVIIPPEALAE